MEVTTPKCRWNERGQYECDDVRFSGHSSDNTALFLHIYISNLNISKISENYFCGKAFVARID